MDRIYDSPLKENRSVLPPSDWLVVSSTNSTVGFCYGRRGLDYNKSRPRATNLLTVCVPGERTVSKVAPLVSA